jgi:hypothetical protein
MLMLMDAFFDSSLREIYIDWGMMVAHITPYWKKWNRTGSCNLLVFRQPTLLVSFFFFFFFLQREKEKKKT